MWLCPYLITKATHASADRVLYDLEGVVSVQGRVLEAMREQAGELTSDQTIGTSVRRG